MRAIIYLLTSERIVGYFGCNVVNCKVKSSLRAGFPLSLLTFQQLNDEVEYVIKESEALHGKGAPVKEKSQQLRDLLHLHQKQQERIRDYEDVLYKTLQFRQVKEEVRLFTDTRETLGFKLCN